MTEDLLFDQYQRYSLAASIVEALRPAGKRLRLIEVGANQHRNLEKFFPDDEVAYLDRERPTDGPRIPRFVLGDASVMPFPSRSVDVVVSLDVFEHVPPDRRQPFVEECARVARAGVVLAAPFQTDELEAAEKEADAYFAAMFGKPFRWLDEHRQNGLPSYRETLALFRGCGLEPFAFGHGNLRIWSAIMRLHFLKEGVHLLGPAVRALDRIYNRHLSATDYEPPYYRHFLVGLPSREAALAFASRFTPRPADPGLPPLVDALVAPALLAGKALFDAGRREIALHEELRRAEQEARARESLLAGDLADQRARGDRLGDQLAKAQEQAAQVPPLSAELAQARRRLDTQAELVRELHAMRQSRSWRLTAPLRRPARLLRRATEGLFSRPLFLRLLPEGRAAYYRALHTASILEASGHFDAAYYRRVHPDVAAAGVRPALHYALSGWREGRNPSESFDTRYYLDANPDVARSSLNPLLHFLRCGEREGRRTLPLPPEPPPGYDAWIERYDTLGPHDLRAIGAHIATLDGPLISVLMPVYNSPEEFLRLAIESVRAQLYERWELCIADDRSTLPHVRRILEHYQKLDPRIKVVYRDQNGHISAASNSALALAEGPYLALLDHDDELPPHALYMVAEALQRNPEADVLYSDEDKIDQQGHRYDPYFKCDWNEGLFRAQNLISHLGVFRTALVREVGGFRETFEGSQDYDLALRCVERSEPGRIVHLPFVLYHWRAIVGSAARGTGEKAYAPAAAVRAANDHFARIGLAGEAVEGIPFQRVRLFLPNPRPLVSLVIPTRDGHDILKACVESVLTKTTYGNYELLVVDNQSRDARTLAYLDVLARRPRIRVLRYPAPFNFSAINNFAVRQTRGEVVCLLNNDVEVINAGWLEEMVSHALRPEIGAVGAKLLYPNDTVQHAGVILGILGVAGHAFLHFPAKDYGYFGRAVVGQEMSAVTAACLAVRRAVYDEVGGLDEEHLSIAFNDVDFCLRLKRAGYRNYWTPRALLYHHESVSRGYEDSPEKKARFQQEVDYMRATWGPILDADPAYSPNLTLAGNDFALAFPPRVRRPWRAEG
jgi:glycosyltransferase involved in cell wall biosynthesis